MDDFSAHDGEHGFDAFDVLVGNGEVVIRKDGEVSELAWSKGAFFAALTRKLNAQTWNPRGRGNRRHTSRQL